MEEGGGDDDDDEVLFVTVTCHRNICERVTGVWVGVIPIVPWNWGTILHSTIMAVGMRITGNTIEHVSIRIGVFTLL